MTQDNRILINADLDVSATVRSSQDPWIASPMAGVERKMLERNGNEVARATSLVRYAPDSFFSAHTHTGGEEFVVLEGVFTDEHGNYGPGTYIRNPIGTSHTPSSKKGCVIFVKLWQMHDSDDEPVKVDMEQADWHRSSSEGVEYLPLYTSENETVIAMRLVAGANLGVVRSMGGLEYFVLEGGFEDENGAYEKYDWVRLAAGTSHSPRTEKGCTVYMKAGHLKSPPALP